MSKRIGYYDYKLDNWHANTYLDILKNKYADNGYEVTVCKALDEEEGRKWAAEKNIPYADTLEDFAKMCDYIMILAPSNPELHLKLAQDMLPLGKTTFIDKTFAPDLETARKIFELADKHGVAVITTSALRFTDEFNAIVNEVGKDGIKHMTMWGEGRSFGEYGIHQVEGVISTMGANVVKVMRWGDDNINQISMQFADGRTATALCYVGVSTPYIAVISTQKETKCCSVQSPIFETQTKHILDFFAKGQPTIAREESLMVREILDIAFNPANAGKWISTSIA